MEPQHTTTTMPLLKCNNTDEETACSKEEDVAIIEKFFAKNNMKAFFNRNRADLVSELSIAMRNDPILRKVIEADEKIPQLTMLLSRESDWEDVDEYTASIIDMYNIRNESPFQKDMYFIRKKGTSNLNGPGCWFVAFPFWTIVTVLALMVIWVACCFGIRISMTAFRFIGFSLKPFFDWTTCVATPDCAFLYTPPVPPVSNGH
jgi:hypothetical protein